MVKDAPFGLSKEELKVARKLWDALVHSSPCKAKRAQQQMVDAPPAIQQALITAIVTGLRSQQELQSLPNPFSLGGVNPLLSGQCPS